MIKCAIHQPHYFPWLGYLHKMASVDKFIILNEAQIEKGSNMYRNKLCTLTGQEKYITVAYEKKGCLNLKFDDILLDNSVKWQERQKNFIINNYKKTTYFKEVWEEIEHIFEEDYVLLDEVVEKTILIEMKLFDIKTEIIRQDALHYDRNLKKNDLLINLCNEIGANYYLSGNGARKYMDIDRFLDCGILVEYQNFVYPYYPQHGDFVPNLSALDLLFNCGIRKAQEIFWESVNENK